MEKGIERFFKIILSVLFVLVKSQTIGQETQFSFNNNNNNNEIELFSYVKTSKLSVDVSLFDDNVSYSDMIVWVNSDSLIIDARNRIDLNKLKIVGKDHPESIVIKNDIQFNEIRLDLYKPVGFMELLSNQFKLNKLNISGNNFLKNMDTIIVTEGVEYLEINGDNNSCQECLTIIKSRNDYKYLNFNISFLSNKKELASDLIVDSVSLVYLDSLGFHDVLQFTKHFTSINHLSVMYESVVEVDKEKIKNIGHLQIMTDTLSGWTKFWMKLKYGKKISFVHSIFYDMNLLGE